MSQPIMSVIIAVLSVLAAILVAALRGGLSERAKSILLGLVAEAESYFGAGTGRIKFSAVLGRLYATMPTLLQVLFSEKTVADWIEEAVASLKAAEKSTASTEDEPA